MPRIRKKQLTIGFHPRIYGKLSQLAEQHETSINKLVRECVENDLPKLIERYRKRQKRRTHL